MKVYIVVEWAIDYFYKIWGVFTKKEDAEKMKEKLEGYGREALDGEIHIVEKELNEDRAVLKMFRRITEEGEVIDEWKRVEDYDDVKILYDYKGRLVVGCLGDEWKKIYEIAKEKWWDIDYLCERLGGKRVDWYCYCKEIPKGK